MSVRQAFETLVRLRIIGPWLTKTWPKYVEAARRSDQLELEG